MSVSCRCHKASAKIRTEVTPKESRRRLTVFQASKRYAIYTQRLTVHLLLLPHHDPHKNQIQHISHAIKWQAELLVPNGVKTVIPYDACTRRDRPCWSRARCRRYRRTGRRLGWGRSGSDGWGAVPVGNVHGHLDERVCRRLVIDFAAIRVFWPW
jgi:hypothetical protein